MRLPFTSKIVAHSRYLPGFQLESLTDSTWTELTLLNHTMSNVLLNHIASLEDKYLGKAHFSSVPPVAASACLLFWRSQRFQNEPALDWLTFLKAFTRDSSAFHPNTAPDTLEGN